MKKSDIFAVLAVAGLAAAASGADIAAYWRFPTTVPATADNFKFLPPIAADQKFNAGPAQIFYDGAVWNGAATGTALEQGNLQYFTGSTFNTQGGDAVGSGLSVRGNTGLVANGKSVTFRFDATDFYDIQMVFAERMTSTGPTDIAVSTSTDGTNFSAAPSLGYNTTGLRDSTFRLRTIDLSSNSELDSSASAYVRLTFSGYSGTSGTWRIDNVTFTPTPASAALLGLGGLVAARRRRA